MSNSDDFHYLFNNGNFKYDDKLLFFNLSRLIQWTNMVIYWHEENNESSQTKSFKKTIIIILLTIS